MELASNEYIGSFGWPTREMLKSMVISAPRGPGAGLPGCSIVSFRGLQ